LVVEDEPSLSELMSMGLRMAGSSVTRVQSQSER
jgi:DNA-binding response OmpR family regulator